MVIVETSTTFPAPPSPEAAVAGPRATPGLEGTSREAGPCPSPAGDSGVLDPRRLADWETDGGRTAGDRPDRRQPANRQGPQTDRNEGVS